MNTTTTIDSELPQIGRLVRVRQRLYVIENVRKPVKPGDSSLVSLSCVEDDAQGLRLEVLWDIEPAARAYESDRWHGLGKGEFDNPAQFAAYINTLWLMRKGASSLLAAFGRTFAGVADRSVAVRGYREKRISKADVTRLLGFETADHASAFLKDRGLE